MGGLETFLCRELRLSDKENIALTSTTKVRLGDEEIVFVILAKKNTVGGGPVDFRFHFYDESGNETTLPEGIAMTMKYHGY